jgi:16S rRNA (cytosine1402-N4)-methyltransferase
MTIHVPVLCSEVVHWLQPHPSMTIVDGTLGGGGHTRLLAQAVSQSTGQHAGESGRIIALDRDPAVVEARTAELANLPVTVLHAAFAKLRAALDYLEIEAVDGVLLDIGLSSDQLADTKRGFSFATSGDLDMRFDTSQGQTAADIVNSLPEKQLADLIYEYGEERRSRQIAKAIVERRRQKGFSTADDLAELVRRVVPRGNRRHFDPATRTFQALRIHVNDELGQLKKVLADLPNCLRPGGRAAIISFHSLEDRIVKYAFRENEAWNILTKKPVQPSETEIHENPRARSSKLRVAERI